MYSVAENRAASRILALVNLLKPASNFTYHQVQHLKIIIVHYIPFMCSQNKQRHLSYTSLTDWFL